MTRQYPDDDVPEEWVRRAHRMLMRSDSMAGVVYRRQVRRVRRLRKGLSDDGE